MKSIVIIPTYNERKNLPEVVSKVLALDLGVDILIVDDNSPDGTGKIADELAAKHPEVHVLHRPGKMGLGRAYVEGFKYALRNDADIVFEMDADLSHDPAMLPIFLEKIKKFDFIVGSRYLDGVRVNNWSFRRLLLSKMATIYVNIVANLPRLVVTDATSGFRCIRTSVLKSINLDQIKSDGYSFQIEMVYKAYKKGFLTGEIPIIFQERDAGASKMNFRIIWEALWIPWGLRFGFRRWKDTIASLINKIGEKKFKDSS